MRRIVPRGMVGRIALVLIAALLLEFAGNAILYSWKERELISREETRRIAEQLVVARRLAQDSARSERAEHMADLTIPEMTLNWVPDTVITDRTSQKPSLARFKARLEEAAPLFPQHDLRLTLAPSTLSGAQDLVGVLSLPDGSFITFRSSPFLDSPPSFATTVLLHLTLLGLVLLVALLMIRALVRPLQTLANAADQTGDGGTAQIPVAVQGPHEVRRVADALSAMQARLLNTLGNHTQALIAVSHDLRTPIQRLRLRAGMLGDENARAAITSDLIEIERFVASALGYLHGDENEPERLVDIAAIAMTLVDDAVDDGVNIEYVGPDQLAGITRPLLLKRALRNLIENADRYANRVRVSLIRDGDWILLSIDDDGPGIPAEKREEAFLPFHRFGERTHERPNGIGLGLAIVKRAVRALSGHVSMNESDLGGLAVQVRVPVVNRMTTSSESRLSTKR